MRRDWREAGVWGAIVLGVYVLFHLLPQETRHHLTQENDVTELLGSAALGAASVFTFVAWRRARRTGAGGRIPQLFLLGMAFAFFLAFGEELSWGQQFFHWGTPEEFRAANKQDETNLHNLAIISVDPYRVFTILFWYPCILGAPLLASRSTAARRILSRVLPLTAWPFALVYLLNDVLSWFEGEIGPNGTSWYGPLDAYRTEVREMFFSLLCCYTAYSFAKWANARSAPAGLTGLSATDADATPAAVREAQPEERPARR